MKKLATKFIFFLAFVMFTQHNSAVAQMVGDQIFLKGKWVQVGVAPNGSLGSTRLPPAGMYNCNSPTFNFWDPGLGAFTGASNQRLMMVYDAGLDGFTVGTPAFFGDYSMPGTPYEGWGIQIAGAHSEAQAQYYLASGATGFAGGAGLTGTNTAYINPSGKTIGVWSGTAGAGGPLSIVQTTTLDTNAKWVNMNVKFRNTGATTLTGVYYVRETDPDNDVMAGGPFTTVNTINYQNDYYHRVMVTGTGTFYTSQTLSLATKDCRAKCFIHSGWPSSTATNLATLWSSGAGGYTFSGTITSDVAIGLLFNLGNIAAGDSTEINYTYIFNGLTGIDSAVANPQLVVNGIARDTTDTVTSCSFTGSSLACSIINGSTADWTGSTWTWAPSTYLAATTGLTNTISVSSITAPITYTITGTTAISGCSGKTFLLTVMPPGATPPPTTTTPLSYCLGSTAPPLTASGIGTIYWWTTPTGGVGSTTAPTPSTATVGTTTWYVSQVVAGCPSTRIPVNVTIFSLSTPITGSNFVCTGFTTTLANATTGGVWTSSNPTIATVGTSSGIVTGMSPGTATISYSVLGCLALTTVTVTTTPAAITGLSTVCIGTTITLGNSVPGGSWSCACPTIASIGSSTGVVTGIAVGTCVMTYDMGGGCFVTKTITVNPFPAAISGSGSVCVGATTALSSTTPGGIWSSTGVTIATVAPLTGVVTGVNPGTVTIRYTVGGCAATFVVTVVTAAAPIVGPTTVCAGSTITLTNPSAGGTWSMACPTIATVNPTTGVVTGVTSGTCTVTYSLSAGCTTNRVITVTATPSAIGSNIPLCVGQTNTLTHSTAGGTWSMACPTVATVGISTGLVTAVGAGTCTVTYTLPSGCIATAVVTVNGAPGAITGTLALCQGASATLSSSTPSGTWTSGSGTVASIDLSTGSWTALTGGTSTITYTAPTGCITTADVTVNLAPAAITGPSAVCLGQTITLASATAAGAWSSSDPTVATVSGMGDVFGVAVGTADITYALASGCFVTKTVTVNAGPAAITGSPLGICVGASTFLSCTTPGGTWTSSAPTVASILSPGMIGGVSVGTATISYTIGATGCASTIVVTVNTLPGAIGGTLNVCAGQTSTLTNSSVGGSWSSTIPLVGTIDPTTGVFGGVAAGTTTVTYSLGTGCTVTAIATVNTTPTITGGSTNICAGTTTTFTGSPTGGTWASGTTTVATIGVGTGLATGVAPGGTTTITYTLTSGCRNTTVLTVTPLPSVITGTTSLCVGQTTTLSSATASGTWSSSNPAVGTISTGGVVTGLGAGTTTITYAVSGCSRTTVVLVNGLPTSITPAGAQVCEGSTISMTGAPSGGTWSSSCTGIGSIATGSGTYTGISAGTCTVTYTLSTGCSLVSSPITVNPLPGAITGVLSVCIGQTTTVSCTPATGTWSISAGTATATIGSTTGVITGTGSTSGTATITYTLPTG
ncbi:MAG: Ig-like domain-containing protein, partial [Flavipsychrobacter sp.]|nr:Ig-like domain-containing protein [Flavipsychrobacter sp.]